MHITQQPSMVAQACSAPLEEICDGTLAANTHLIQEVRAERYGVSRHPIQPALALLRNDGAPAAEVHWRFCARS